MKTLEDFIKEEKEKHIHKCVAACQVGGAFPRHTGPGHYGNGDGRFTIDMLPETVQREAVRIARQRFSSQPSET